MASWFNDNFDEVFDGVDIFDLQLEDVEENQAEDGQLEQLDPLPWDIGFLSGCSNVHTDAPLFQNNGTILQDDSSLTKPPLSDVKPISGRSNVKYGDTSDGKFPHVFQTTSPVSVLESSNTHSVANRAPLDPKITFVKRPRTKRQRPESLKLAPDISYKLAAKKTCIELDVTEEPKNLSNGHLSEKYYRTKQKKETGLSPLSNALEMKKFHFQQPFATRKCMHCETTSTPQWREGPQGPKTLCNACGVRYRTGRLFPEYRPAGSPTFVASLHSNSHKKVMELRNNAKQAREYCCKNTPS